MCLKKIKLCIILCLVLSGIYASQKDTLIIVSWNVQMLPSVLNKNQIERAHEIVKTLQKDTMDIIVFQELFHKKARKIISEGLSKVFKYSAGPGLGGFLKLNCGVMIFSKYPIEASDIVHYNDCKEADCIAKKAMVYSKIKLRDNKRINFFGTHFQSKVGKVYDKIRSRQIQKMELEAQKNIQPGESSIFAGDFNINDNDSLFQKLLSTFKSKRNKLSGTRKYSYDTDNTMHAENDKEVALLDHILLDENGNNTSLDNVQVIRYQYEKNGTKNDMSDHYAIKAKLIYE